jgi:hypothetical protein
MKVLEVFYGAFIKNPIHPSVLRENILLLKIDL